MKCLSRIRNRNRNGRCYELTVKAMLHEPGADQFTLVHGEIDGRSGRMPHAWIEIGDGRIYDPSTNNYWPADEWGVPIARYTRREMADQMRKHGHSGPWHDG